MAYPALLFLAWVLRRGAESRADGPAVDEPAAARRSGLVPAALLGLALAVALGGQTVRLRDRLLANRLLRQVQGLTVAAANAGRLSSGLVAANLAALRRAAELDPTDVQILTTRASQFMLLERPQAALAAYQEALALEPRPEIYLNIARAYLAAGDMPRAQATFERARRLDPQLAARTELRP